MNQCVYQCINGVLHLVEGNCPFSQCPANGGACTDTSGLLIAKTCPEPFGKKAKAA